MDHLSRVTDYQEILQLIMLRKNFLIRMVIGGDYYEFNICFVRQ